MGKVYVLENDCMPGIVKIGITSNSVEQRMRELDKTGVPLPFKPYYVIECGEHYVNVEKQLHSAFGPFRVRENREFFEVNPEKVVKVMKLYIPLLGAEEIKTSNDMIDSDGNIIPDKSDSEKTERFSSFSDRGINIGDTLVFTRDENITCTVVSDNKVEFEGEEYSLSSLASKLFVDMGYSKKLKRGPQYFMYNGRLISEI